MGHLIFTFYILAIISGFISVTVLCLLYSKYNHRSVKYYMIFLSCVTLLILIYTIAYYNSIFKHYERIHYNIALVVFITIIQTMILITLPNFIYSIVKKKLLLKYQILYGTIAVLFASSIIFDIMIDDFIFNIYRTIFLILYFSFHIFEVFIHVKNVSIIDLKKTLKRFFILSIIFLPLLLINIYFRYFSSLEYKTLEATHTFALYFFIWNIREK